MTATLVCYIVKAEIRTRNSPSERERRDGEMNTWGVLVAIAALQLMQVALLVLVIQRLSEIVKRLGER